MTTIAYDGKTVAYDSRSTAGDTIISNNADKKYQIGENLYFVSCSPIDGMVFAQCHNRGEKVPSYYRAQAFIVKPNGVYIGGINEDGTIWEQPAPEIYAIGSGTDHALTAMDMGSGARKAVEIAAWRDTNTGGRVRTHKVK